VKRELEGGDDEYVPRSATAANRIDLTEEVRDWGGVHACWAAKCLCIVLQHAYVLLVYAYEIASAVVAASCKTRSQLANICQCVLTILPPMHGHGLHGAWCGFCMRSLSSVGCCCCCPVAAACAADACERAAVGPR
jgi:hypothetical protein